MRNQGHRPFTPVQVKERDMSADSNSYHCTVDEMGNPLTSGMVPLVCTRHRNRLDVTQRLIRLE